MIGLGASRVLDRVAAFLDEVATNTPTLPASTRSELFAAVALLENLGSAMDADAESAVAWPGSDDPRRRTETGESQAHRLREMRGRADGREQWSGCRTAMLTAAVEQCELDLRHQRSLRWERISSGG